MIYQRTINCKRTKECVVHKLFVIEIFILENINVRKLYIQKNQVKEKITPKKL